MIPVIIICSTILIALSILIFVAQGIVHKHLDHKRDVYRDMDVLLTKVVVALDRTLDRTITRPIEINEETLGEVDSLKAEVKELLLLSDTYDEMKEQIKDLQGRVSVQSVGKAFSPRRKG